MNEKFEFFSKISPSFQNQIESIVTLRGLALYFVFLKNRSIILFRQ